MEIWLAIYLINHEAYITVFDSEEKVTKYREELAVDLWSSYRDDELPTENVADILFKSDEFADNGASFDIENQLVL